MTFSCVHPALAQRLWPHTPVQPCEWLSTQLAELLRDQIRHEHDTGVALAAPRLRL